MAREMKKKPESAAAVPAKSLPDWEAAKFARQVVKENRRLFRDLSNSPSSSGPCLPLTRKHSEGATRVPPFSASILASLGAAKPKKPMMQRARKFFPSETRVSKAAILLPERPLAGNMDRNFCMGLEGLGGVVGFDCLAAEDFRYCFGDFRGVAVERVEDHD